MLNHKLTFSEEFYKIVQPVWFKYQFMNYYNRTNLICRINRRFLLNLYGRLNPGEIDYRPEEPIALETLEDIFNDISLKSKSFKSPIYIERFKHKKDN